MALDDAAVRRALRQLVAARGQLRRVRDAPRQGRRHRDNDPGSGVLAGIGDDPHPFVVLGDRAYGLRQAYHLIAQMRGQALGELAHAAADPVLLGAAHGREDRLGGDVEEVAATLGPAGTPQPAFEGLPVQLLGARRPPRLVEVDGARQPSKLQVHFVELPPGKADNGHGHQNEAVFYILEWPGYEIHDGQRYDWEKGDLVVVHTDCVHRHFNASDTGRAVALVMKAKALWMCLGLIQQGRSGPVEDEDRYGPREDWSLVRTPGVADQIKVVTPAHTAWEMTPDGRVRVLSSKERTDQRIVSVDLYEQEIPAGSRSARHWHMADEVVYVISGRGHSLHWEVEAEIADRY